MDETFHIINKLWELKEEMLNLIVEREFQDMAKKTIEQEIENDEDYENH